jgi:hypothetical protein
LSAGAAFPDLILAPDATRQLQPRRAGSIWLKSIWNKLSPSPPKRLEEPSQSGAWLPARVARPPGIVGCGRANPAFSLEIALIPRQLVVRNGRPGRFRLRMGSGPGRAGPRPPAISASAHLRRIQCIAGSISQFANVQDQCRPAVEAAYEGRMQAVAAEGDTSLRLSARSCSAFEEPECRIAIATPRSPAEKIVWQGGGQRRPER